MMQDELETLMELVDRMPRSAAKTALLERGVELADADGDVPSAFRLRKALVEEAVFGGMPEKALAAFSWNLAQSDRDPQTFPEYALMWQYKWIVHGLRHFPQIPRAQVEEALDDIGRRYQRQGGSPKTAYKLRCELARHFGDAAQLRAAMPLWTKASRDFRSDCRACDLDAETEFHVFLGNDRRALRVAEAILEGNQRCSEVPHTTFALVLLPLVRCGRRDEAAEFHRRGWALNKDRDDGLTEVGRHLVYATVVQDFPEAVRILQRQLPRALEAHSLLRRYDFLRSALVFARGAAAAAEPPGPIKLRLPESAPLWNPKGRYALDELEAWFQEEARGLAVQFDARSGNDMRTREVDDVDAHERLACPQPASVEDDFDEDPPPERESAEEPSAE